MVNIQKKLLKQLKASGFLPISGAHNVHKANGLIMQRKTPHNCEYLLQQWHKQILEYNIYASPQFHDIYIYV